MSRRWAERKATAKIRNVWIYLGHKKEVCDENVIYHLERASVSISAERTTESVKPNNDAAFLKSQLVELWSPHLSMLGDFHTHPYDSIDEVKNIRGYEFSEIDYDSFIKDDFLWEKARGNPIMLVMTICRLRRVRLTGDGKQLASNIWTFDAGHFRFWLNAEIGYENEEKKRVISTFQDHVFLDLNSKFYNDLAFDGDPRRS
ncbi:hypothetical protein [Methylovirgula sp. HY1]|uniref:hypothetical protein n=1 Tax=Methylovirgula sp. HY1 TaxID=2822761 RepID=UPI001C5B32D6|nr:hypothetical protein [Methylovirgula sp. HY1]